MQQQHKTDIHIKVEGNGLADIEAEGAILLAQKPSVARRIREMKRINTQSKVDQLTSPRLDSIWYIIHRKRFFTHAAKSCNACGRGQGALFPILEMVLHRGNLLPSRYNFGKVYENGKS